MRDAKVCEQTDLKSVRRGRSGSCLARSRHALQCAWPGTVWRTYTNGPLKLLDGDLDGLLMRNLWQLWRASRERMGLLGR